MPTRRPLRRRAFVAASLFLASTAVGFPAAAQQPGGQAPVPGSIVAAPAKLATPILSARRVPNLMRSRIADAQLADAVQAVVDEAPETSCLSIASSDRPVFERNENLPLEPASTNKLLSSYAILETADPDERLSTVALAASPAENGVVRGDLWIVGGGDGMLNTNGYRLTFEDPNQPVNDPGVLADRIKAAGITEISGNIVGDESRYDVQREVSTWPTRYRQQDTVGSLSALMVNRGVTGYADSPDQASGPRLPGEPALLAAETIETLLEARGVRVSGGPAVGTAPPQSIEIARLESAPIGDLVAQSLAWSDNTTAELLTKELGVRTSGEGTTAAGTRATKDLLSAGGFSTEGIVINDGSGLDIDNRLTCDLLVELLHSEGPDSVIGRGLAVSGQRGTLRKRMVGTEVEGKVLAKTGTLTTPPALALAGFVTTRSGERVTFAFIQNGTGSDVYLQDELALAIYEYPQAPTLDALGPKPPTVAG